MKKFIALILALAMVFSVCTTLSFAANDYSRTAYKGEFLDCAEKYDTYLAFGDSMSRGVGVSLTAYDYEYRNVYSRKGVEGALGADASWGYEEGAAAYPFLVSEAVDCLSRDMFYQGRDSQPYYPICFNSLSVEIMMDLLGYKKYNIDDHFEIVNKYGKQIQPLVDMYAIDGTTKTPSYATASNLASYTNLTHVRDLDDIVKKGGKSLMTLNLGLADVFLEPILNLEKNLKKYDVNITKTLTNFASNIKDNFLVWEQDYKTLITNLYTLSGKKADIVLVGYFNPLAGLRLADETVLPVGDIMTPVVALMNKTMKEFADQYDWCQFVDISNAETMVGEDNLSVLGIIENGRAIHLMDYIHLTPNGQRYVARQILSAVEDKALGKKVTDATKYDITVDFARKELVGKPLTVKVNGLPVLYTKNGTVLTIQYNNPYATTLSILIENGNDTVCLEYFLVYENDQYVAYKVFGTNDLEDTESDAERNIGIAIDVATSAAAYVRNEVKEAVQDAVAAAVFGTVEKAKDAFESVPCKEAALRNAISTGRDNVAGEIVEGSREVVNDLVHLNYGSAMVDTVEAIVEVTGAARQALVNRVNAAADLAGSVISGWKNFLTPGWGRR